MEWTEKQKEHLLVLGEKLVWTMATFTRQAANPGVKTPASAEGDLSLKGSGAAWAERHLRKLYELVGEREEESRGLEARLQALEEHLSNYYHHTPAGWHLHLSEHKVLGDRIAALEGGQAGRPQPSSDGEDSWPLVAGTWIVPCESCGAKVAVTLATSPMMGLTSVSSKSTPSTPDESEAT